MCSRSYWFLLLTCLLLIASCAKEPQPIKVTGITLNTTSLSLVEDETADLVATISPKDADNRTVIWSSSNGSVAGVNNGKVTALKAGSTTITAKSDDGGFTASCSVTVSQSDGHEAVDLGLSVKWATCNVGASTPEGYGDHFAWGETSPKSEYTWSTYIWCDGSSSVMTKYNTSSYYGTIDHKTQLDLSDDAARANWGGKWRMPTKAEQDELQTDCTWTWTTQNGINGHRVTSKKNGSSIFLPAAGICFGTAFTKTDSLGHYWSSTLEPGYSESAYFVCFGSDYLARHIGSRSLGLSVRPVTE